MPLTVGYSAEEAFNLATIRGAHAMKMAEQIGSIAEGKLADLVIFDANTPSMICASVHDPVAAIILHSSPADVDMVIIDGVIQKMGKLLDVQLDARGKVCQKLLELTINMLKPLIHNSSGMVIGTAGYTSMPQSDAGLGGLVVPTPPKSYVLRSHT